MRLQLTKLEKSWILYDIANSAFILLVSTLLPISFDYLVGKAGLSESDYLAYWGYAGSLATNLVALIWELPPSNVLGLTRGSWAMPCGAG